MSEKGGVGKVSDALSMVWDDVAAKTEGFTGADLRALVSDASMHAVHRAIAKVSDEGGDGIPSRKELFARGPAPELPDDVKKMGKEETVCKFCGVSYLIFNEVKALEGKLRAANAALAGG